MTNYFGAIGDFCDDAENVLLVYDDVNTEHVVIYEDDTTSNWGAARVIIKDVDGGVTFNTVVYFDNTGECLGQAAAAGGGKVLITYRNPAGNPRAVVGTITGSQISFGTPVVFPTTIYTGGLQGSICYDSTNSRFVCSTGGNGSLYVCVGTVTGTTVSFGTPQTVTDGLGAAKYWYLNSVFEPISGRIVIGYGHASSGYAANTAHAVVGLVSGTNITMGTEAEIIPHSDVHYDHDVMCVLPGGKIAYAATEGDSPIIYVGTVSGNTLTGGATSLLGSITSTTRWAMIYDSILSRIAITYEDFNGADTQNISIAICTLSGTIVAIESGVSISGRSGMFNRVSMSFDPVDGVYYIAWKESLSYALSIYHGYVITASNGNAPLFWTNFKGQYELTS